MTDTPRDWQGAVHSWGEMSLTVPALSLMPRNLALTKRFQLVPAPLGDQSNRGLQLLSAAASCRTRPGVHTDAPRPRSSPPL